MDGDSKRDPGKRDPGHFTEIVSTPYKFSSYYIVTLATSFCDAGSKQEKLSGVTGVSNPRRLR